MKPTSQNINSLLSLLSTIVTLWAIGKEDFLQIFREWNFSFEIKIFISIFLCLVLFIVLYFIYKYVIDFLTIPKWQRYRSKAYHYVSKANQNKRNDKPTEYYNAKAAQFYKKAIDNLLQSKMDWESASGGIYIRRGGILKRLGQYDDAIDSINRGLIIVKDVDIEKEADAYYNLACIYAAKDNRILFNDIMYNKIPNLDNKVIGFTQDRIERWLKKNCPKYAN